MNQEHGNHHDMAIDWAKMSANLEREAEMMLPYVTEATEAAAGFRVAIDRVMHVRRPPPLTEAPRQIILRRLHRLHELFADRLDAADRAALDVLIDEGDPLGVMQRDDVFLDESRHVYIATASA